MYSNNQFIPVKGCSHSYTMLFESDFCCCTKCKQKWVFTDKGWRAVPPSWQDGMSAELEPARTKADPYEKFKRGGGKPRPSGARLKPVKRNMRTGR